MTNNTKHYCVGFLWYGNNDTENQLPRFQRDSIWENGFDDKYINKIKSIPVGSQLAAKTSYTRKQEGKTISVLEVHAIGKVIGNPGDGKRLQVEWQKDFKPFMLDGRGAYRSTISQVNHPENIRLIFENNNKEEAALVFNKNHLQSRFPLNQILFGPPGTGKTFNTINKAVSIIDQLKENALSEYYENRQELKERFEELCIDDWNNPHGQIGFITFHQSMSYEDFIEGIKPDLENKELSYDIEPGIFKKMVSIARDNWLDANKGVKEQLSFEEAFARFKDEWDQNMELKFPLKTPGYDYKILGFTKTSIRFEKASGGTGHTLSIATLRDYFYDHREIKQTGVGIYYPAILEKLKSYQPSLIVEKEEKNYVLIIDEINRGNVSQIFGELITLIEEDKRLGCDEALQVTLPYSKEKFGVPPNLYIIGTMNTADRSVEALDAALRRRFCFEEMPPHSALLKPSTLLQNLWHKYAPLDWKDAKWIQVENTFMDLHGEILDRNIYEDAENKMSKQDVTAQIEQAVSFSGINLEELLTTINKRIEKLTDKDHQIGHSYFIKVGGISDLQSAFQHKIVPLLQEYFFGDYGKIGLVLGSGFFEPVEKTDESLFATIDDYDASGFAQNPSYKLKNISAMSADGFKAAVNTLLKK